MKDPEFVADANQRKFSLDPENSDRLDALIKKSYATPRPIIDRIAKLIDSVVSAKDVTSRTRHTGRPQGKYLPARTVKTTKHILAGAVPISRNFLGF